MEITENLTLALSILLAWTALACVLCLKVKDAKEFVLILTTLIIGVCFINSESEVVASALIITLLIISLLSIVLYKARSTAKNFYWGVGTFCLAILAVVLFMLTNNPALLLLAVMITLPIFPLHGGYLSILTGLPLAVSAFFSLLLPLVGLFSIYSLLGHEVFTSGRSAEILILLAVLGALYGSLKALIQKKGPEFIAYAGLSLSAVLWLGLSLAALSAASAFVYLSSLGVVTAGLLLLWRCIVVRYEDVRIDTIIKRVGGLSKPMPVFGVLVLFILWAAIGLPPFGLFMGFVEILVAMSVELSWHIFVVLLVWFMASWYFIVFLQKVLFGPKKRSFEYKKLNFNEGISLGIIILILLILGLGSYKNLDAKVATQGYEQKIKTELSS
jgi:NADH-quinone oxidoreductase subunit M